MSGLPMSADTGHAFSVPKDSERERDVQGNLSEVDSTRELGRASHRSEYFSAWHLSGNRYAVVATPFNGLFEAEFPTVESAESHALALNEWLAARPSPDLVAPFFVVPREEPSFESLLAIFARMLRPETPWYVHGGEMQRLRGPETREIE